MFAMKKTDSAANPSSKLNPFDDSDDEQHTLKPSNRISPVASYNPFDDYDYQVEKRITKPALTSEAKSRFKNGFRDSGGLENQNVQELESYAVYKSEETTKTVQGCLKVAEDMRSNATRTLVMLNEQGEKLTRTHHKAVDIDRHLSRGEKLLGRLGGIFSRTWKPKKTRSIAGPRGESPKGRVNHLESREKLGLNRLPKPRTREPLPESANAYQKVEMEIAKQDDGLEDLSGLLGELKIMAVDMGTEIERQNSGLDHLHDDVEELNFRVKQSNQRTRRLLGK